MTTTVSPALGRHPVFVLAAAVAPRSSRRSRVSLGTAKETMVAPSVRASVTAGRGVGWAHDGASTRPLEEAEVVDAAVITRMTAAPDAASKPLLRFTCSRSL